MADERKRPMQVNFRLSRGEYKLLEQLEGLTGETRSILLRRLIKHAHRTESRRAMDSSTGYETP